MKIYFDATSIWGFKSFLNIQSITMDEYFCKRSKYTGDTYIIKTKYDRLIYSPGESARIYKK